MQLLCWSTLSQRLAAVLLLLYCLPYSLLTVRQSQVNNLPSGCLCVLLLCCTCCNRCAVLRHLIPVFNLEKIKLSEHFFFIKMYWKKICLVSYFLTNFIWLLGQHNQNGKIEENIFLIKIENYFIGELCYQTKLLFDCSTFLFLTENPRRWL